MYDFHDFGLTWKCQKICPCGYMITSKTKINVFWKIFFTPSPLRITSTRNFFLNVDFSLWSKQCIVLPKWTFFRVLPDCDCALSQENWEYVVSVTWKLVQLVQLLCWRVNKCVFPLQTGHKNFFELFFSELNETFPLYSQFYKSSKCAK